MRIAIDARTVARRSSGIGNYAQAFIRDMVPMARGTGMEFTLLRQPESMDSPVMGHPHPSVREIPVAGNTKSLRTVFTPGLGRRLSNHALYHSPADMIPPGLQCPVVVTIHDAMWMEVPHLASGFMPERLVLHHWYTANYGNSIRKAAGVITISKASADGLIRCFPNVAHKMHVIHHGIDREKYNRDQTGPRSALEELVPSGIRYSLAVGQGSPYKNHANMIRAFVKATGDDPNHKLVLVRRFSRVDFELKRLLALPQVKEKVIVHSYIPDHMLLTLYAHAEMLLFVSRYEGFGMPALEAMALGVPVIGSTAAAVAEVTGDAALHGEPEDVDHIASCISKLDGSPTLREELIGRGHERTAQFTWEKSARAHLEVYKQVLGI